MRHRLKATAQRHGSKPAKSRIELEQTLELLPSAMLVCTGKGASTHTSQKRPNSGGGHKNAYSHNVGSRISQEKTNLETHPQLMRQRLLVSAQARSKGKEII